MLVHAKSRKLVLNLENPGVVMTTIPTSEQFEYRGRTLVAVPHHVEEVRVLRNMGIEAPGPILSYYGWPGMYTPFEHQRDTSNFLTLNPRAFCLNDMGTGKTLSVLWAYDYLRSIKLAKSLLVIGPLSGLERTWGDEVFKHFPHLSFATLHGSASRRLKLLDFPTDVFIINHDGIKTRVVLEALVKKIRDGDITVVVPDELAVFRNSSTERWKALRSLVEPAEYVWGLTGTPIPNEPTDAWAQIRLIAPSKVPRYFGAFRDAVMRQMGPYKWVARTGALDHVYSVMQPAIRYAREDCIDLPPTTYVTREVALSPPQKAAYKQMLEKFRADLVGGHVTALSEATKLMKLLQIVCGVVYTDEGDLTIPAPERLELVKEIIEEAGAKVIVFVPLTGALLKLADDLRQHFSVEIIHGGTPKAARDQIFGDFQKQKSPRVIVANPAAMSHSITLTAANTIVWFTAINSAEIYQQANARIVRPGQVNNTVIVHCEGSELERRMYARLQKRQDTQGVLLSLFETETAG
jgi:SNF2 family DNA or RNA helicase